ncbi:MAG: hypothetical protein GTO67_05885 [Gammaproteobacteria bacterium]|nr:hypothetical protein [Gammaproteobacteria bacterium]NIM72765.1 hypothetical protein [Gammaproteobacteria bacterium]NIN38222.1 hypothetical protein [Gammaproteobacteria bacterium]NIO24513.1 hypothetical protein [Gammaproteobacteria bacterium]NIO65122.1 hypothetical protein [Gammaproteobacteria bacterium]
MRNSPDAAGLLRIARDTLLNELLDALPEERHYAMRMAANALAMAAREAESGDADLVKELRLLSELYGEDVVQAAGASLRERIAKMNKRFARDIRDGIFDGACAQGVQALLMDQVCARLQISNPKYLEASGLD